MYDFEEQTIRDVVASPYCNVCIEAIFATLRDGGNVRVQRHDGTITTLTTEAEAHAILTAFGWSLADASERWGNKTSL